MDKLKMHSPNLTQDNIDRIREVFPACVMEAKGEDGSIKLAVDFDQLRQELTETIVEGPQERYQLNWPGKREALLAANSPIAKTLRPCREDSVDFDTTENLFIEGDNLDALKLLQQTYLGKVKMIYIDPPYNTGNDYVYSDDFSETSEEYLKRSNQKDEVGNRLVANTVGNGSIHSTWLTMIYSRLRLAKGFLSDDGAIFISIDDHELHNLRKICDEIFGEGSFVATFPWRSRTAKADVPFGVSNDIEWIVCYGNPNFRAGRVGERKYYQSADFPDRWRLQDLTTNKSKEERPNSFFTMVNPRNGEEFASSPIRTWAVTSETFADYYKKGKVVFPGDYDFLNIKRPAFRVFENEDKAKAIAKYGNDEIRMSISTYLPENDVGRTEHGSKEIRDLFGSQVFLYPKPTALIQYFIEAIGDENALVMDFFAGSGTSAQAVLQQNAKDGGKRRFILVQIPEVLSQHNLSQRVPANYCMDNDLPSNICSISKERLRKTGEKIRKSAEFHVLDNDLGFRVLKIDTSNMADVYYAPDALDKAKLDLFVDNIKANRRPEDLLFQVMLDWGVDLALPIAKQSIEGKEVFFVDGNALAACFDAQGGVDEAFVKELAKRQPLRVVFRDAGFKDSAAKINVEQIFKLLSPATDVKCI